MSPSTCARLSARDSLLNSTPAGGAAPTGRRAELGRAEAGKWWVGLSRGERGCAGLGRAGRAELGRTCAPRGDLLPGPRPWLSLLPPSQLLQTSRNGGVAPAWPPPPHAAAGLEGCQGGGLAGSATGSGEPRCQGPAERGRAVVAAAARSARAELGRTRAPPPALPPPAPTPKASPSKLARAPAAVARASAAVARASARGERSEGEE